MRYPIGRISKLLGLSTETIRTYERKGIVHPQKNENGYRVSDSGLSPVRNSN